MTVEIQPGTRLGAYEILSRLGAGGMGEVWRARDTRLDREVAIKLLPAVLAGNEQFRLRLEREAKTISQLNHPHICTLHDIGHDSGVSYLVMELLDGESLADRIARGPLPLADVLKFGTQIAAALDRAHRSGIVHRDLKPANVVITKAGAKLLDFGLAKSSGPVPVSVGGATEHKPLTQEGTILGTFQYMAPEQLEGAEADARTDIFALGSVLYEMATAHRAFEGKSKTSLIAAIVDRDPPPISQIQPLTPPSLEHVISKCLAKDPEERWQSAHDVMSELAWISATGSQGGLPATARTRRHALKIGWIVAVGAALAAAALGTLLFITSRRAAAQTRVMRTEFVPDHGERLSFSLRPFAVSPDGLRLVYSVEKGVTSDLRLRSFDADQSTAIPGTEGGTNPFFSPDGKWIAFVAGPKLRKVAVAGGTPVTLCDAPFFRGGAWGDDGWIYFAGIYVPVMRVRADGGVAQAVTKIRSSEGEQQHRWPEVLPGSKAILYTVGTGGEWDEATIVAERLDTGERKVVIKGGTSPRFLDTGHLLYARGASLYAVSFDARSLTVDGPPVEVARNVLVDATGFAHVDLSRGGMLVMVPSEGAVGDLMLAWVSRDGRSEPLMIDHQAFNSVMLSPDDGRAAVCIGNTISLLDLARLSISKLTLPARAENPVWSRDGRRVFFGLEKDKYYQIFSKAADDSGTPELAFASDASEDPFAFSGDGSQMLAMRTPPDGRTELYIRPTKAPSGERKILFKSLFLDPVMTSLSPDGRWVAYQSQESGRSEIYVRPASGEERKWQISTEGGAYPVWSRAGGEIFFTCGPKFLAAPVEARGDELVAGPPAVLFDDHEIAYFDASRDGKRFLVAEPPNIGGQPHLEIAVNWSAEVSRKVRDAKAP